MTAPRRQFLQGVGLALVAGAGWYRFAPNGSDASSRVWYVDGDTGNDKDTGGEGDPFATITRSLQQIQAGDTVEIASGSYSEKINVTVSGTEDQPITLTAAKGADVTVKKGAFLVSADYIEIANVTIDANDDDDEAGIFVTGGTGIVLRNVTATNNDGGGLRIKPIDKPVVNLQVIGGTFSKNGNAGIAAVGSDALVNIVIQNVTTADNAGDGIQIERASQVTIEGASISGNGRDDERNGVFLKNVKGASVRSVFTEANGHDGIALRQSQEITVSRCISTANSHHGFDSIEGCSHIAYYNNVSWKNGDTVEDKGIYVTDTNGVSIVNNILVDNAGDQLAFSSEGGAVSGVVSDFNLIWRSSGDRLVRYFNDYYSSLEKYQGAAGLDLHSISADPMLDDPASHQYTLGSDSPAINAGTEITGITDGFSGSAPDIGAMEFAGS